MSLILFSDDMKHKIEESVRQLMLPHADQATPLKATSARMVNFNMNVTRIGRAANDNIKAR